MLAKYLKCFFPVPDFCWRILRLVIFKICGKIDLKIHWFVKTPLHGHKRVAISGLRAPDPA